MKIEILSYHPDLGYAYVRFDGMILQIRPPYFISKPVTFEADAKEATGAINHGGYQSFERTFSNWDEVKQVMEELVKPKSPPSTPEEMILALGIIGSPKFWPQVHALVNSMMDQKQYDRAEKFYNLLNSSNFIRFQPSEMSELHKAIFAYSGND